MTERPRGKLPTLRERNERYIRRVFKLHSERVGPTARALGIGRASLYRYLTKMGVNFRERTASRNAAMRERAYRQQFTKPLRTL